MDYVIWNIYRYTFVEYLPEYEWDIFLQEGYVQGGPILFKDWVHLKGSEGHIWGWRGYMEQAMNFTLGAQILGMLVN